MSVVSLQFLLFMAALLVAYFIIPKKLQWVVLLLASLVFYCIGGIKTVVFILITAGSVYGGTMRISAIHNKRRVFLKENKTALSANERSTYKKKMLRRCRLVMLAVLLLNLGILCAFKYLNFVIAQLDALLPLFGLVPTNKTFSLIIPLGISFYTFQTVGYLVDVYWENCVAERNPLKLLLFVSFFPQITQGPISSFNQLQEQLLAEHTFSYRNYSMGIQRMIWGFFKKLLIADMLAPLVGDLFANYASYTGLTLLFGAFMYSAQIYADFSGYMDIVCGACEIMGIRLTENFNRPYFSKSVAEYWRRWHISLGEWFKAYVYYPIAVSSWNTKLGKNAKKLFGNTVGKTLPATIALIVVWLTTGFWHGASWGYVLWGGLNGFFIILSLWLETLYSRTKSALKIRESAWLWRAFQVIRTFILVTFIKVLPEVGSLSDGFGYWKSIFTNFRVIINPLNILPGTLSMVEYGLAFGGILLVFVVSLLQRKGSVREWLQQRPRVLRYGVFAVLVLLILIFGGSIDGYTGGFMYAQF